MLTLIYFILILGLVVFIHELGHYLFAKKAGVYVYEFSLGMGPKIFKFNRKPKKKKVKGKTVTIVDETDYCIRLFPIGGFVQMAGEEIELDEKIPENKRLQSKTWGQRFMVMVAGVMNNFILAFVVLLIIGWTNTLSLNSTKLTEIDNKIYPTLQEGDRIVAIDGVKIKNFDRLNLELQIHLEKEFPMKVKHSNGEYETVTVKPIAKKNDKGELESLEYGFHVTGDEQKGFIPGIKFACGKWISTVEQMFWTVWYLITGKISVKLLSGPVGIYKVVGQASEAGFSSILSLIALLNINVGFINILPLPAFDGGHALFLIIEKIKGSPVNQKVENTIHTIFFVLLMILMVYVTFNDILRFF